MLCCGVGEVVVEVVDGGIGPTVKLVGLSEGVFVLVEDDTEVLLGLAVVLGVGDTEDLFGVAVVVDDGDAVSVFFGVLVLAVGLSKDIGSAVASIWPLGSGPSGAFGPNNPSGVVIV